MHSIQAKHIKAKKRHPHLEKWRKSLRQALLNPALSEMQRDAVKRRLEEINKGKDYCCEGEPLPSAIPSDAPAWGTGTNKNSK